MKAIDMFMQGKTDKRTVLLAYLEYHYENPSLHPDNAFSVDSGYSDIGGVIVNHARKYRMIEIVRYPTALLKIGKFIYNLHDLSLIEEQHVGVIEDFLDTFDENMLDDVLYSLFELRHLDENEILDEISEILVYVKGAKL